MTWGHFDHQVSHFAPASTFHLW